VPTDVARLKYRRSAWRSKYRRFVRHHCREDLMSDTPNEGASRRNFLKLASVSAPAAVAAVALGRAQTAEAATVVTGETLLQDTAHTRAYLDSARF
jgi:hypothetical protein